MDVRDEAMIAIIAGDIALADTAVDELIDSHAEPADWLLAAHLAIKKNLPDEAESYLEKIVADSRATESEQFRATLLQLSLAAKSPSERANALTRLGITRRGKKRDIARRARCCCTKHARRTRRFKRFDQERGWASRLCA